MTKLNSRQKRKYRSYGMTITEAENMLKEIRKNYKCPQHIHCSYMDYISTDEKHIAIIKEAQHLRVVGKHAGSKPIKRLRSSIYSMKKLLARYAKAFKEKQRLEAQKNGENN